MIGPYDHRTTQGTQQANLRNYPLDPCAFVDVKALTFAWFDHIFKGAPKPDLVQKRINLQVMGANSWQHLDHWADLKHHKQRFYLSKQKSDLLNGNRSFALSRFSGDDKDFLRQAVNLADRTLEYNDNYYPWPIVQDALEVPNGFAFVSEPMDEDVVIRGQFDGKMRIRLNKKDADLGLVFFELTPEGSFFHLSYILRRASYAKDMTRRQLLTPGQVEEVPIGPSRMTGRLMRKGSRLVVMLNVNFNRHAQVNYGTGKDVSDETIDDAGDPLQIDWFTNSYIEIQTEKWTPQ